MTQSMASSQLRSSAAKIITDRQPREAFNFALEFRFRPQIAHQHACPLFDEKARALPAGARQAR